MTDDCEALKRLYEGMSRIAKDLEEERDELKAKLDDAIHDITHCEICGKEESGGCLTICFDCDDNEKLRAELEQTKARLETANRDVDKLREICGEKNIECGNALLELASLREELKIAKADSHEAWKHQGFHKPVEEREQ